MLRGKQVCQRNLLVPAVSVLLLIYVSVSHLLTRDPPLTRETKLQGDPQATNLWKSEYEEQRAPSKVEDAIVSSPQFKVITAHSRVEEGSSCGGCTVLFELADEIKHAGFDVETLSLQALAGTGWDCHVDSDYTVVIFPEGPTASCKVAPRITVRWILAPIGSIAPPEVTQSWHQHDWVYAYMTYAPGAAMHVPDSNVLMVLRNPMDGDMFDKESHPHVARTNKTCYSYRKMNLFHAEKHRMVMHDATADDELADYIAGAVQFFLSHKYFISYDPYTYLAWIASWLGCIPIVHPIANMTKLEWILSTAFGPYVRETGRHDLMHCIAYGNSTEEVSLAERYLEVSRQEFLKVKDWGKTSVKRFIHDVYVNITGKGQYKGRLLVKDYYPTNWTAARLWEI